MYRSATFLKTFAPLKFKSPESITNSMTATTIGKKIMLLRYSLDLTQLQFARSIGRVFGSVTKWEQELTTPSKPTLDDIINIYDLEDDYFDMK